MTSVYSGTECRLVLSLDFGTTSSGIAYAILEPGQIPEIQSVTRFPGQDNGVSKIPSVMVYNRDGSIRAAGAEAGTCVDSEDQDFDSVEWFKLRLCPRALEPQGDTTPGPPIPFRKTGIMVIADFLDYLYRCAQGYIRNTHTNGASLWQSVQGRIDVVLSHPNGWGSAQQTKMREAAVLAKHLPKDASGRARLHFVTEGEASLHYCLNSGLASDIIKDGSNVILVDCGATTIDLTTYKFVSTSPVQVEETAAPGCILQGSAQVNARFRKFLQDKLRGTTCGTPEDIDAMMERFEESTKPTFSDPSVRASIKFGGMRDRDPSVGIRNGTITIEGTDIEKAFKPSVDGIADAIRTQRRKSRTPIDLVFLVGGFAASPWLHRRLQTLLRAEGVDLFRPGSHTNKAVSEGAVSFCLTNIVLAPQDAQRISQLETEVARRRNEVADLQGQLDEARAQRGRNVVAITSFDSRLRAAEEETRDWKSQAESLADQLQASQSSHEETKHFLELRTNELILAQTFLPEVDSVSYTQVLSMVENLNDLGFQLASHVVDNSTFPTGRRPCSSETRASVEEVLGKAMTQTLISDHHAEAPMLVQVALLAAIAAVSFVLIQRWDYAFWPAQDNLLSGIHRKLLDLEPQAASASWRALVRRCIREINRDEQIDHVSKASADLLDVLKNTLEVSGGIRSEQLSDQEMLKKTREIVELCLEFQRVVGEDVASTCFDVLYPFPGATFASDFMEDMYMDDGARGRTESSVGAVGILCTVDLGLKRRDKVVDSSGVEKVEEFVLLKARTVLPVGK